MAPHAAESDRVITHISIETTDQKVKVRLTSTRQITWKLVRQKAALVFCVSPVDPDPNTPKEIPINTGLIRKVRFLQQHDREKNLLIVIDVVPFPAFKIEEDPHKRGLSILLDRKELEVSRSKSPKAGTAKSRKKYSILFAAAAGEVKNGKEPPLVPLPTREKIDGNKEMFYKKEPKSVKKDLDILKKAALVGTHSPRAGKEELLNLDFDREDIVKMLKFLAARKGLSLAAAPQVKGTKSIVLSEVTAEEAVGLILKGTSFTYKIERNVLLVGPPSLIKSLSLETLHRADTEEVTRVVMVSTMRAEGLVPLLSELFPTARVSPFARLNALIITAGPSVADDVEAYIRKLEHSSPGPGDPPEKDEK
jgi:hypothetical protein